MVQQHPTVPTIQRPRPLGSTMFSGLTKNIFPTSDYDNHLQVLGSLITHIGSGVPHEVGAALDTLLLLVKKHAPELLPMSSFLNGQFSSHLWR